MLERDTYLFKKIALGLLFIQGKKKKKNTKILAFPWKVQRELAFGRTAYLNRITTVLVDGRITTTIKDLGATTIVGVSLNRNIATIFIDISICDAIDQNHHAYIKNKAQEP